MTGRAGYPPVQTADGEGPPALLLHAGGEDHTVWAPVAAALAAAGCSAAAHDLAGHGERAGSPANRLEFVAQDVPTMIEALPAAPVVVGASLGGFAALLALADPDVEEAVAGLVLVDVVPDPQPAATRVRLNEFARPLAAFPIVDDILSRGPALRAIAAALRLPVLLVRGGTDSALTDGDVERFKRLVPGAEVASVLDAGHLIARDRPDALARLVVNWLRCPAVRRRRIDCFLRATRAAVTEHPGGTLLDHMHRTGDALQGWNAKDWIVDAGRMHAAYGTDGFALPEPLATRSVIRCVVGAGAEELVHRYGSCERTASYPSFVTDRPFLLDRITKHRTPLDSRDVRALVELTVANELDVFAHAPQLAALHGDEMTRLFAAWRHLVSAPARAAIDAWASR